MVVVGAVAKGARWGECRLTVDAVLLLCQSARNVEELRAMPIADWLRVRLAPTGDAEQGLSRAMRVESRLNRQGIYSPSPPVGTLAGNEGALTAWAEAMAEEWSNTGYLFRAVEDGGLGVTQARGSGFPDT